jgi:hypothetical protein
MMDWNKVNGAIHEHAERLVTDIVDNILEAIEDGDITNWTEVVDRCHEEVDTTLVYTKNQWLVVWVFDAHDAVAEGMANTGTFAEVVEGQAYHALVNEVMDHNAKFEEALKVAEDKRLEAKGD